MGGWPGLVDGWPDEVGRVGRMGECAEMCSVLRCAEMCSVLRCVGCVVC